MTVETKPRTDRRDIAAARNTLGAASAVLQAGRLAAPTAVGAFVSSVRWAAVAAVAGEHVRRLALPALADLAVGVLFAALGWWTVGVVLAAPGLVWAAVRAAMVGWAHTDRGRLRAACGSDGFLDYWGHRRHLSAKIVRDAAVDTRPSVAAALPAVDDTAGLGVRAAQRAQRMRAAERLPAVDCGTHLGRTAVGSVRPMDCFAPHRDTVGVVAAPQSMKTAWLAGAVIDFPGAVVTTSTKPDALGLTGALRAQKARSGRIEVFDPQNITGNGSTFRWSPLVGCHRAATAEERAAAFVLAGDASGSDDARFWGSLAVRVLRCLLLAAALDGRDMLDVARWAGDAKASDEALAVLEDTHRSQVPRGWAADLRALITGTDRSVNSIFLTLSSSLGFMGDPAIADTVCPGPGEPQFDVESFLADRGTLYLLGSDRPNSPMAPLLAVLASYIFNEAQALAARGGGRLDPPLMLALDEVALVVPVPLDRWLADAGGRGIHIVWACQSLSQLADRWGEHAAATIWNATNVKLIPGGLSLVSDIQTVSDLAGTRLELVPNGDGGQKYERVPVLPFARIRELPRWHAVLLARSAPVTIVKIVPAWTRGDVRRAGPTPAMRPIRDEMGGQQRPDDGRPPLRAVS